LLLKCGLLNSEIDKRTIIMNLILEGMSCLGKNNGLHKKNLIAFLEWCETNDLDLASSITPDILKGSSILK